MEAIPAEPVLTPDANGIIYVKPEGTGTGNRWEDAVDLAAALKYAQYPDVKEIWVAKGTYVPKDIAGSGLGLTDRDKSFVLVKDVAVYGGFAGTETLLAQRNPSVHKTILSGNIGDPDTADDNAYHVVIAAGDMGTKTRLDGFDITGGNGNRSGYATVNSLIISYKSGGGIYIGSSNGTAYITGNNIYKNTANDYGGGIYVVSSNTATVYITGNSIYGNTALFGGGIYGNPTESPSIIVANNSIYGNTAGRNGGGIYVGIPNVPVSFKIYNCIIWGNDASTGKDIYHDQTGTSGQLTLANTLAGVRSLQSQLINAGGNLFDIDPLFTDPANGDFSLQSASPAIDAGKNDWYTAAGGSLATDTDLAGNPRLSGAAIDMGAYEYVKVSEPPQPPTFTLTLIASEGLNLLPSPGAFSVGQGQSFTFYVTLAEGYEGRTPQATVNGEPINLQLRPNGTEWMYVIPWVDDDVEVVVSFSTTANLNPDIPRLYTRDGRLFIEATVPGILTVYSTSGQQYLNRRIPDGLTSIALPAGVWLVRINGQTYKVVTASH